jgi:hypothetical protein
VTPERDGIRILVVAGILLSLVASPGSAQVRLLGPPDTERPVPVGVGFYLTDIVEVDDGRKTFEFEGVLTLSWYDERQRFDPAEEGTPEKVYQGNYQFSELATGWWPQLALRNESGHYERQGMVLRILPDGNITYVEELQAVAEVPMDLRRIPFDRQRFEVVFEVLGFDASEVLLAADPDATGASDGISVTQWRMGSLSAEERIYRSQFSSGREAEKAAVAFEFPIVRNAGFLLRIIVLPLLILVSLSWSVFWMDAESLGDRMSISFVGILTVVAFQIVVSDMLPRIPYFTILSGFLLVSYLTLVAGVIVNLRVGALDKRGDVVKGNRLDRRCRRLFPLGYAATIGLMVAYYFVRY